MKGQPVTAVVVNYNAGSLLGLCLDGLRVQAVDRIVVVDNASSDESWRAAERDDVVLVRSDVNLGFAGGVNAALHHTTDPFVFLVNADARLSDGYVEALRGVLTSDDTLAAATGMLLLGDDQIDSTGIALTRARWASDRDRSLRPHEASGGEPFGVSGAASLWRRVALDSVGTEIDGVVREQLWPSLFVYWDDVELAWRLRRAGWRFVFEPAATAHHPRGSDSGDATFVEAASFGNRLATIARHEGVSGLVRPATLLVTLVVALRLALRRPGALRRARPFGLVRAGLRARRADHPRGWPLLDALVLDPHPWRAWFTGQVTGFRRGLGSRRP